MNPKNRKALNPLVKWLWDLLSLVSSKQITVPAEFREQVLEVEKLLDSDVSGIVGSLLDFAINNALVDYTIEAANTNLTKKLNNWLLEINSELRGKVPTGLKALAYQYFRERWKGGSLLLLRSIWETKDGISLPTKMWFVDGANIQVKDGVSNNRIIGKEKYALRLKDDEYKSLPSGDNELIFVQKPYGSWSDLYPVPFLVKRGLFYNLKLLQLIAQKGENFLAKALEYLLIMRKGTENLALKGGAEHVYSEADLKKAKKDFQGIVSDGKTYDGTPTYATNFDTEFEHLIPDYEKVLKAELFAPVERRILAGLGLIDIVQGTSSTRRESILSPKPFIAEIRKGVSDFQSLLYDIVYTIVERNKIAHPKYFSSQLKINTSHMKDFIDDSLRNHLRSMYDRGQLSKQTYSEVVGEVNFDIEVERRRKETDDDLDDVMYPPVTENREGTGFDTDKKVNDTVPPDKKGIEKKNFKGEEEFEYEEGKIVHKKDGWHVVSKDGKNLGGPYNTRKEALKRLRQVEHFKNK